MKIFANWTSEPWAWGLCSLFAFTASPGIAADDERDPVAIGERAPAFELPGADGETHTLAEFREKGMVALLFFRSADW